MTFRPSFCFGLLGPLLGALAAGLAACAASTRETSSSSPPDSGTGFDLAQRLGCGGCHAGAPFTPAARLASIGERRPPAALTSALAGHDRLVLEPAAATRDDLVQFLVAGSRFEGRQERLEAGAVERGRQLLHGIGCVACHEPFEPAASLEQPLWDYAEVFEPGLFEPGAATTDGPPDRLSLRGMSRRFSRSSLAAYLLDPLAVHPGGRMPDLGLGADEAADLASYLWYEDGAERGAHFTREPGLVLEYFEGNFPGETVDFDALTPLRREIVTRFFEGLEHADDDYAFRFRGFLEVEAAGAYTFSTASDDGSMLHVDGALVVDNRGQHGLTTESGRVTLAAGAHALELTYFEHQGDDGLFVRWEGPGFDERELGPQGLSHYEAIVEAQPVAAGTERARGRERGELHFGSLGCGGCHGGGPSGPPFAELRAGRGCLAQAPEEGHPTYDLTPEERHALAAASAAGSPPVPSPSEHLAAEFERLRCGACHAREGLLAGPDPDRQGYFRTIGTVDLGDEGRLPPHLDGVGAKLKPVWLREVLVDGARARPYMQTRMPRFGAANVEPIAALLQAVDAPQRDEREPEFTAEAVEIGRRLAGTKGLGCIQCHDFVGHPSIGIPAVDLAHVHDRLYPGWFRRLLMDPIALKMNTRMPTFWEGGQSPIDVLDRDPARQVDALWSYLSLGSSMPLPEGLVPLPNEFEVEVHDRPVSVGVFMKDVSPRTVCVGYPERLNIAYDVQNCRLALAWRGRFLDARGTWFGRAGQLERPAGEDVLVLPRGPAVWTGIEGAWPTEADPELGLRVLGRRIDAQGRPTFLYSVAGVEVRETVIPQLRPGGAGLLRRIEIAPGRVMVLRLAVGSILREGDEYVVQGAAGYRVRLRNPAQSQALVVVPGANGTADELRLVASLGDLSHFPRYEVEYTW